ncbi:hypothetical protein FNF27_01653 [Cafeteria roenbergensis]|uniref:EF-hand domain-containing protein n=1 Tax=Cafeteria roenbergensis TaxID=33653 RepID=A0A5A8DRL9_CAFRO|nr:hypothetical protein FNF29_03941 [Cafeteria roenbergensis]KAA0167819.1 hypothetical protein FNF31_00754 [Cafeteria roenbergensis]KAA0171638.1 hypothetical protein FNF28_00571 [Cafeteria roenbergensis]KAA0176831.1 hypothetical protein FNF27_01653 [Cafeteria roenbergensis]|eukprot:KAA0152375.1 hypothetical protein FNF29_03941 [Cafeteria roenbergensis]
MAASLAAARGTLGGLGPGRRRRPVRPELSEDQRAEIKEAFDLFDTDRSGAIDYHELKVCMRALGFDVTKEEVQRLMSEHDVEGKGEIGYSAFEEIMRDKFADRDPEEEIRKAFRLFDEEGKGTISVRNLRRICRELGEGLSDDELRAMIDEFDRDDDGEINEEEFFAIMRSTSLY